MPLTVLGIDTDPAKVDALSRGELPFFEPGLAPLLRSGLESGRLSFSTSYPEAAAFSEGHAVQDTMQPDRIVAGVTSARAEAVLAEVYAKPIAAGTPFLVTDLPTAETVKVAANASRLTRVRQRADTPDDLAAGCLYPADPNGAPGHDV
jgi:UDP-glucose 6-dehydrogenase